MHRRDTLWSRNYDTPSIIFIILAAVGLLGLLVFYTWPDPMRNTFCWRWSKMVSPVEGYQCFILDGDDDSAACFPEDAVVKECGKPE